MKKWLVLMGLIAVLLGGYLSAAHLSGGAFPTPGLTLGGERGELRRTALSFWEDVQFKDFERAASYHSPELQDTVDIPFLLQRLFLVKPEQLDIMEIEVVLVDVDSSGLRARVKTRLKLKELTTGRMKDPEVMLYFHRDQPDAPWFMVLEDSLRDAEADENKKHR